MSQVDSSSAKKSTELTLIDRLSRLSYQQTLKLLGSEGPKLLRAGDSWDFRIEEDVCLSEDLFRLKFPLAPGETESPPVVTISLMDTSNGRLQWHCTVCESLCEHVGAAFSFILDEKMTLGLAAPPPERVPVESLSERELIERAIEERRERARTERMIVKSAEPEQPWTDYAVSNTSSGKTYRVAVRGRELGDSYCACPDFRTNTLGTCKHILHVLAKLKRRFTETELKRPYHRRTIGVHVQYRDQATLRLLLPERLDPEASEVLGKLRDRDIEDVPDLLKRIQHLERRGHTINIYPDAEEFIQRRLLQDRIARRVAEIRRQPESHPLRRELLKAELLPYQLDGIAFAAGAGRAVLADDMGLGKTIQAIGVSELLVREVGISKVLVICPASVKSQWRNEIRRFCDRDCQLIVGSIASRGAQYANDCFFTVCNYEQVLRDILSIERVNWNLIILDEGQRIKNWEAKTSRVIKGLRSQFALVLSGTPLENRIDELYSVVQFIDDRRLGPAFRFYNRHRVVEENGKVLLFSEWTTMLDLIEPLLEKRRLHFVRLDGSVPQKLRQGLVQEFQSNPGCRLFLTTNAGSTGLNLQAANTVINVDLPWNPAVLEQRIARAYRMGQEQPVQVFVLITEDTIEEKLLATLSAKHDLALAALDAESDVDKVDLAGGIEELRRRLEVLLGARPEAPSDQSLRRESELAVARAAGERHARRERLAVSGGHLLSAAFQFLGELLPAPSDSSESTAATTALAATLKQNLTDLVEPDDRGRPCLTFALPDATALDGLTNVLARLLVRTQSANGL